MVIQKKLGEKFLGKSDWMSFRANWNGMKTETSFHNPNFNQALEYRIVKDSIEVNIDTSVFKEATLNVFEKELLIKSVTNLPSLLKLPNNKEGFTIKCIHDWKGKNILLFGSEGFGIKAKTLENSDFRFKVKMNNNIESLNISNTVSVVCHHVFQSIK